MYGGVTCGVRHGGEWEGQWWIGRRVRACAGSLFGVLCDQKQLALVILGLGVALEAVLVSALFRATLAVPPELLQALGLDSVANSLRRHETGLHTVKLWQQRDEVSD